MSQDYMSESQKLESKSLSAQTDEALHDAAIWMQRALAAEEKLSECIASHQKTNARLHEAEENLGQALQELSDIRYAGGLSEDQDLAISMRDARKALSWISCAAELIAAENRARGKA